MDRLPLYPTEVFVFRIPEAAPLNAALLEAILTERDAGVPSVGASVTGGWHSPPDLAMRGEPFRTLTELIVQRVRSCVRGMAEERGLAVPPHRWGVHGWSVVLERGGYNVLHDHAEAHWSVAWYVDAGDADPREHPDSGMICFVDPRRAAPSIPGLPLQPGTFQVRPESQMLVVFPGFLQHYVTPYQGERPRVIVSMNLKFEARPPG